MRPRGQLGEKGHALSTWWEETGLSSSTTAQTQSSAWVWNRVFRVGWTFFRGENAKGNFWSDTQATVILKRDSLLVIFHLYHLPVRISWPIKLIFLNPNFVVSSPSSQLSMSTSQFLVCSLHIHPLMCSSNITEYLQWRMKRWIKDGLLPKGIYSSWGRREREKKKVTVIIVKY